MKSKQNGNTIFMEKRLRLGFACKIVGEGEDMNIRSLIKRRLNTPNLKELIAYNIGVLYRQFDFLARKGIEVFRMCSDVVPFGSSKGIPFAWQDVFSGDFYRLGEFAKKCGLRLSMHPGQYTVLNSPSPAVVEAAVSDLNYHAAVLDAMGMERDCKIVLHVGGVYGDKNHAISEFIKNYETLSPSVKKRLILENDHNRFHAQDVLEICRKCDCPMVFDLHHHELFPAAMSAREILLKANKTWHENDGIMKVHYSQSGLGSHAGVHSQSIQKQEFVSILPLFHNLRADIMLEVKDKNQSVERCQSWLNEWEETQSQPK